MPNNIEENGLQVLTNSVIRNECNIIGGKTFKKVILNMYKLCIVFHRGC